MASVGLGGVGSADARWQATRVIPATTGTDIDDHAHAAAAGVAATVLLSLNLGVGDSSKADMGDVRVMSPDDYLVDVLDQHTDTVLGVLEDMGGQRRDPQATSATLAALAKAGLTAFAVRAGAAGRQSQS